MNIIEKDIKTYDDYWQIRHLLDEKDRERLFAKICDEWDEEEEPWIEP